MVAQSTEAEPSFSLVNNLAKSATAWDWTSLDLTQ